MTTSREEKATSLTLKPYDEHASILVNRLLCTPCKNTISIQNIDTKTTQVLECRNIRKLVRLPGLGFASFLDCKDGFRLQVWKVSDSKIAPLGKSREFTGEKEKINFNNPFASSPDGRYLAIKTYHTRVYQESYGSEHVVFTGVLIIDTLKDKSYYQPVSEDTGTYCNYDNFNMVFTHSRQLALYHHFNGWLSIYNLDIDQNEDISLLVQLEKRQISASNNSFTIYPSPNGKYWLRTKIHDWLTSVYLLDPTNPTGKQKLAFKYKYGGYDPYWRKDMFGLQWLDDRIIIHIQYKKEQLAMRDTIEIHDFDYHERWIIAIPNLEEFTITERGELFALKKNNEYELLKLPKSKVKKLLQQYPQTHITPFVRILQETPGSDKLSTDLDFLIQDYARQPMSGAFFQPAKIDIKKQTESSVRRLVDKKIKALQKKKSQIQSTLLNKNEDKQSELKQIMIDSLVLHLLKDKMKNGTIQVIKDGIEEALETGASIQPVSFELLQFLDSIKMSLGSEILEKEVSLAKQTSSG